MKRLRVLGMLTAVLFTVLAFAPACFSAIPGYALHFDGVEDLVFFDWDMGTALPENGTVEAWIKLDSIGTDRYTVLTRVDGYHDYHNYFLAIRSDGYPAFGLKEGSENNNAVVGLEALQVNKWYHIAGTFDGSDVKIYVNGSFSNSAEQTVYPPPTDGILGIGRNPACDCFYFPGAIDDVRLWDHARTEAEIFATMETKLSGSEVGLKAYWSFDEGMGQYVYDSTVNANDGLLGFVPEIEDEDPTWIAVPEPGIVIAGAMLLLAQFSIWQKKKHE